MKHFEEKLCNEGNPSSASTAAVSNEDGVMFNQFSGKKEQTLEVGNPPDKLDAMEVSRQVAIEVRREVEGQTESSCSSSPKEPDTETKQPNSPASATKNIENHCREACFKPYKN